MIKLRLRDLREDKDITQKELAELLHIKQNTYAQYENGQREIPLALLVKLARYFNVSVDFILYETNNPRRQ